MNVCRELLANGADIHMKDEVTRRFHDEISIQIWIRLACLVMFLSAHIRFSLVFHKVGNQCCTFVVSLVPDIMAYLESVSRRVCYETLEKWDLIVYNRSVFPEPPLQLKEPPLILS